MTNTQPVPAKQPSQAVAVWTEFENELQARGEEIGAMLPTTIPRAKFHAVAMSAIKQNPALLRATTRSLVSAITKAAQDGLLPDGREGFINVYNTKVKGLDGKETWQDVAQWMPMVGGLRKRAKELDGILIDAQVVYMNDSFLWVQGDEPRINHTPAPLGKDGRGEKIGAYAIFKREDGTILHREVMDYGQIEKARSKSKAPDSLMWKDFAEEGYRKTVVRRGVKSVPVSEKLLEVISRDDDLFEFAEPTAGGVAIPPRPSRSEFSRSAGPEKPRLVPTPTAPAAEEAKPAAAIPEGQTPAVADEPSFPDQATVDAGAAERAEAREAERRAWMKDAYDGLAAITKVRDVPDYADLIVNAGVMGTEEEQEFRKAADDRVRAIMDAAKAGKAKK
jgi:phage RecT family recombinase